MSKVKIQGHASGTGVLTVTAPNSDTDRTITLPDSTGELIAKDGSGNLSLGDNVKAKFGASDDLQIYHDGNNSYIDDTGVGDLYIRGSDDIRIQKYTGETMIHMDVDGGVFLNYDNAQKLGTTSTGIDVTGQAKSNTVWVDDVGSAASPSLVMGGDVNTGFFDAGTDAIGITTGGTERMRIDSSGVVHFHSNPTSSPYEGMVVEKLSNGTKINIGRSSDSMLLGFYNNNGLVGYINTSGSSTVYTTSSDYRLKENVVPMTGSIDRLKELNPSRFNFITNADKTVDGFLAHEAQTVVPECVVGEKDAMRTEEYEVEPAIEATYDEEGNELTPAVEAVMGEREVEDYQGIDQSKLVPLLTSALQEAVAKIEELTTRIETLEAN